MNEVKEKFRKKGYEVKIYEEQYKDKMDWNEFQKLYKDGRNAI